MNKSQAKVLARRVAAKAIRDLLDASPEERPDLYTTEEGGFDPEVHRAKSTRTFRGQFSALADEQDAAADRAEARARLRGPKVAAAKPAPKAKASAPKSKAAAKPAKPSPKKKAAR